MIVTESIESGVNNSESPHGMGRPLLSIITGFYNSVDKSTRLLERLRSLREPDVEIILVDDGSTDGTLECLKEQQLRMGCRCILLEQSNRGPGGGRNTGLRHASGRYVWFVDADDDFNPAAIAVVRRLAHAGYDFIDFGIERFEDVDGLVRASLGARVGELDLPVGEHSVEDVTRLFLLRHIGWLATKVFRRDFLAGDGMVYPEYCVYEDTYLFFELPFLVRRFYKSDVVGYYHHQERESVTRSIGRKGPRFYDRLAVTAASLDAALRFDVDAAEKERLADKFTNMFLFHTLEMLRESGDWAIAPRVMRLYREEIQARSLGRCSKKPTRRFSLPTLCVWWLSYLYPSQTRFFQRLHAKGWRHPIVYPHAPRTRQDLAPGIERQVQTPS